MTKLVLNFDDGFIQEVQQTAQQQGLSIESYFKQLFYRQKIPISQNHLAENIITDEDVNDFLAQLDTAKRKDTGNPPFWAHWNDEEWGNPDVSS